MYGLCDENSIRCTDAATGRLPQVLAKSNALLKANHKLIAACSILASSLTSNSRNTSPLGNSSASTKRKRNMDLPHRRLLQPHPPQLRPRHGKQTHQYPSMSRLRCQALGLSCSQSSINTNVSSAITDEWCITRFARTCYTEEPIHQSSLSTLHFRERCRSLNLRALRLELTFRNE